MRNDRPLDLNEKKIDQFRSFLLGYGRFTGIKNITLIKILYVTYSNLFEKHDKLLYIVIDPIDFERDPI